MADRQRTSATDAMWRGFRTRFPAVADVYDVVAFGDSPDMVHELADLVVAGGKRATACLLRDVASAAEQMPRVGGHVVVVDGAGEPRCVWRTTEVTVKPMIEVDDGFARDEGEGNRTRADWLDGHRRYFARQAARQGWVFEDREPVVFERFAIVWPAEIADRPDG